MDRVARLMKRCNLSPDEGILITKASNMRYLSAYTGEGMLVISANLKAIVTDFRYVEQAQNQAPGFEVHSISTDRNHAVVAAELLKAHHCRQVRFEDDDITVREGNKLNRIFAPMTLVPLAGEPEALRSIKDEEEIALIKKACDISCRTFEWICGQIKPGMSEIEIRLALDYHMLALGAEDLAFSTIIASGPNGSLCHAIPGQRKVEKGDMITMDFGAKVGGYCADMTRTVALGQPGDELKAIYQVVYEAQCLAQDALAPGKTGKEVDAVARDHIKQAGYGAYFGHGLGHSLGLDIHEDPRLSLVGETRLEPNMIMTVEPGIYIPGLGGVRIENSCVLTGDGAETLVWANKDLLIL